MISFLALVVGAVASAVQAVLGLLDRRQAIGSGVPLVIVHEASRPERSGMPGGVLLYVTVDRAPAFDIRFGVMMDDVRVPFHLDPSSYRDGRRERILRPGDRYPSAGSVAVEIPWWMRGNGGGRFHRRMFWARYKDEKQRTWETINPANEAWSMIGPRRVHGLRIQEYQETLRRSDMKLAARRPPDVDAGR